MHFIDKNVDEGDIIAVKQTPLYSDDTLSMFAARHYYEEIIMLANYKYHLQNPENTFSKVERCQPYRRMPLAVEEKLEDEFLKYKAQFSTKRRND